MPHGSKPFIHLPCKPQFSWNTAERSQESPVNSRYTGKHSCTWLKWHSRNVFYFSILWHTHKATFSDTITFPQWYCWQNAATKGQNKMWAMEGVASTSSFYCVSLSSTHWDHYSNSSGPSYTDQIGQYTNPQCWKRDWLLKIALSVL